MGLSFLGCIRYSIVAELYCLWKIHLIDCFTLHHSDIATPATLLGRSAIGYLNPTTGEYLLVSVSLISPVDLYVNSLGIHYLMFSIINQWNEIIMISPIKQVYIKNNVRDEMRFAEKTNNSKGIYLWMNFYQNVSCGNINMLFINEKIYFWRISLKWVTHFLWFDTFRKLRVFFKNVVKVFHFSVIVISDVITNSAFYTHTIKYIRICEWAKGIFKFTTYKNKNKIVNITESCNYDF